MRVTVKEVAAEAGVSKGTVDRVLHRRGEVSQESRLRVLAAVEKLGYTPNMYASVLASRKNYRLVCLFPKPLAGEYWELVAQGVDSADERSRQYNVTIHIAGYDQFDRASFRNACAQLVESQPDAVVIAPMFRTETITLCKTLEELSIPYVFIDSRIQELNYTAYFGMPMWHSGYLGGSLLVPDGFEGEIANIRIERGASPSDNPTTRRREGFLQYLAARAPKTQIFNAFVRPYEPQYNDNVLDTLFAEHPNIRRAISFNSRVHLIADYLERRKIEEIELVGYDVLDRNVEMLRSGHIRFLIAQRTRMQVSRGVEALVNLLAFRQTPHERDNYMSMDILTRENIDFYRI